MEEVRYSKKAKISNVKMQRHDYATIRSIQPMPRSLRSERSEKRTMRALKALGTIYIYNDRWLQTPSGGRFLLAFDANGAEQTGERENIMRRVQAFAVFSLALRSSDVSKRCG